VKQIEAVQPDVVVINPTPNLGRAIKLIAQVKQRYPNLPVISMSESLQENHLDAIMNTGVSAHLNRQFSRPRDLLVTIEQIIV
jgi:DNA-binding NarL/FixJ family response regulator